MILSNLALHIVIWRGGQVGERAHLSFQKYTNNPYLDFGQNRLQNGILGSKFYTIQAPENSFKSFCPKNQFIRQYQFSKSGDNY